MPDEYDIAAMQRAQSTASGRIDGGVSTFSWGDFAQNLYGQRGNLLKAFGTYEQGQGYSTYFSSMASSLGLQAGSAGLQAQWANLGRVFPELQQQVINIQTNIARNQVLDKWLGRVSATKTRYAKSGVAIDDRADTPMKAMLTLLESSQEELHWIDTDKKIREFNEVFMPGIEARVKESSAIYQKDLMKINQDLSVKSADIASTLATTRAWIQMGSSVVNAAGSAS